MLRIILLSLFWAICSTCLVRPYFWKQVFSKKYKRTEDIESMRFVIGMEICIAVFTFFISIMLYMDGLYQHFFIIAICLIWQLFNEYLIGVDENKTIKKKKNITIVVLLVIFLILGIQDLFAQAKIVIPLNKVDKVPITVNLNIKENTDIKTFISANEIASLFKVEQGKTSGPTYNNGKYIYTINGRGIVIIDRYGNDEAKLIECVYEADESSVRLKYPTQMVEKLYITISDDNVPYRLWAKCKKSGLLGKYYVDKYIMSNLITGEIEEFEEKELPDFVFCND